GMTPEARSKVFLPFFTTKPTGTGLGLVIVKKIMDLHGGHIEIDSTAGRGTAVRLVIPARGEAASPPPNPAVSLASSGSPLRRGRGGADRAPTRPGSPRSSEAAGPAAFRKR